MAIPEGWSSVSLATICDFIGRGQSPCYIEGPSEILAINQRCVRGPRVSLAAARHHDPTKPVKSSSILRDSDVCVNSTGTGTIGRSGLWSSVPAQTYFADTHITIVRPITADLDAKFLVEWLASESSQRVLERDCFTGSTNQVELNRSAFASLALLLPPLPEQKKIAAILSSVDDTIAKTESVIAQLQIVKKAMMEQLLTKGMPGRHTRFKQTEIGEIPEEWEVVRAGELCEVITKGATPKVVTSASPDCVPFLRVQNIGRRGEIDLSGSALFVTERTHTTELMRSQIRPGDVLMNIVGPPLGKIAVVPISIPRANINQAIALLRPARIESEYLSLCLTAEHLFAWLLKQAKRTSTQLNLTLESCREFPLPLPDQAERREIIACTVAMQLILDAQQTELVALREVKSSLSSSLLSGEIRVIPEVA